MVMDKLQSEQFDEAPPGGQESISRVVLIVFLFVLFCLIVPSLVGENKGIPSLRFYGCAVILAGVSALIAGRIAHHRYMKALSAPDQSQSATVSPEGDRAEVEPGSDRNSSTLNTIPGDLPTATALALS